MFPVGRYTTQEMTILDSTRNKDFAFDQDDSTEAVQNQNQNDQQMETSSTDSSPEISPEKAMPQISPEKPMAHLQFIDSNKAKEILNTKKNPDVHRLVLQKRFLENQNKIWTDASSEGKHKSHEAINKSLETYDDIASQQHLIVSGLYEQRARVYQIQANAAAQTAAVFQRRIQEGMDVIPMKMSSSDQ